MGNPRDRLGALIRAGRTTHEPPLTQEALAERLGVTQPTISEWESGKQIPKTTALLDLSRALNLQADTLLEAAGEAARPDAVVA